MKIIKDIKNELLKRKEVQIVTTSKKNPTSEEAIKIIASEFKADEENIVVYGIKSRFGRNTFMIAARIYDNKEDKEATELKTKKQRKAEAEAKAAPEEAKEAEKPAEPVAEETKEEVKEEPKEEEAKAE